MPMTRTLPDGRPRPQLFHPASSDPEMLQDAVPAVRDADWVVAVVRDTVALTGEGRSTATLELQGSQIALVEDLIATGKPVTIVLIQSKPSVLPDSVLNAAAIIEAFNPGMEGGRAIAELVLGLSNPGAGCRSPSPAMPANTPCITTSSVASTATVTPTPPRTRSSPSEKDSATPRSSTQTSSWTLTKSGRTGPSAPA